MREVIYEVPMHNSYPANGESFTPAMVGLKEFVFVDVHPIDEVAGKLLYAYDYTNQKIVVLYPTGGTGAGPGALGDPIIEAGTTAVTGSGATGKFTPGRGIEIGDTTDLTTVDLRVRVVGF